MGFSDDRGDALTVRQIEFARADPLLGTPASSPLSLSKADIMRVAEIIVLFVTALLIIFLVARPLVKGASGAAMPQGLALAAAGADAGPAPMALPAQGDRPAALPAGNSNDSIDIEKIDGQVKASSLKKVANIVESHPEESIAILRSWLHEG
jgi:flagellar M-ring protein FliF